MGTEQLIGTTEAARIIGVSTVRVTRDLDDVLRPLKLNGRRLFDRAAVEAYAAARDAKRAAKER